MPWAGDLARSDLPRARPDERVGELRGLVLEAGFDLCVVCNEASVVLGLIRGAALGKDPEAEADTVMELGPKTIRPDSPVETLLASRTGQGSKSWIVTNPHGVLLGVLLRADAERALEQRQVD